MKTLNLDDLMAGLTKSAGLDKPTEVKVDPSAELANILEKKASEDITASAFAAGEQLAKDLLVKLAGDNIIQTGDAVIVAEDDKKIVPNQTGGTIDAPLEGTVEEALARGAKSDDLVNGEQTKEAQIKLENSKMATAIMQKIAQIVGEPTTTPAAGANLEGGSVPNVIQEANAVMTAQDDAKVQPLPGAEGTLNSILEAVVARAEEQGAVSDDLVNGDTPASSAEGGQSDEQEKAAAVEALVQAGCDFDSAVAMVKQAEEALAIEADQQEKIAAIDELCAAGYDFDSAVALVKQAEAELSDEVSEQEKVAAVDELMGQGYGFDDAVALVKQAVSEEVAYGTGARGKAREVKAKVGAAAGKFGKAVASEAKDLKDIASIAKTDKRTAFGLLKGNKVAQGAAVIGVLGAGAAAKKYLSPRSKDAVYREKKAAFDALVEAGIDFDQAAAMVKQAEVDVYGE